MYIYIDAHRYIQINFNLIQCDLHNSFRLSFCVLSTNENEKDFSIYSFAIVLTNHVVDKNRDRFSGSTIKVTETSSNINDNNNKYA